ncbi:PPC domain-containing protein [Halomarina salina]|uniref:PPC domain-containing protein n=1 Tax=Halomarina salina TaxID=1872699 RepID=A0ABD5RQI6_9EURY|nr:PPC domain-containing protein [Halomarina salina]
MRSRRPADRPDSPRVRTALPRIAALVFALVVVTGSAVGAASVAASPTLQESGDEDPQSVELGSEVTDTLDVDDSIDVFTFDVEQGDYVRVDFLAGTPDVTGATLYGPSGAELDSAAGGPDTVLLGGQAPEDGQYSVEFTYSGTRPSSDPLEYTFSVQRSAPDSYESNDGIDSAAGLSEPGTVDATLGGSDDDYYAISAAEGATIAASIDKPNVITNGFALEILDGDGNVLAESSARCTPGTTCGPADLSATAPEDGEYYVHVTGGITGFNDYSLTTDFQSPSQQSGQDGDGDPRPVETGTEYTETLDTSDSTDAFTFDAEQGDYIRTDFQVGSPDTVEATLYGPSGDAIDSADGYVETVLVGGQAPESGEYRVEFTYSGDRPSDDPEDYDFTVNVASPDQYESNDDPGAATSLSSGSADAVLGEGDDDYYVVSAAEGSTIAASIDKPSVITNAFTLQVLDDGGNVLAESSARCTPGTFCDPEDLSVTAPEDGEYYVLVTGGITGYSDYSLSVDSEAPTQDTETPDDTETTESPDESTETPDDTTEAPDDTETPDESTETPDETDSPDDTTEAPDSDQGDSDDSGSSDDTSDSTDDSGTDDTTDESDDSTETPDETIGSPDSDQSSSDQGDSDDTSDSTDDSDSSGDDATDDGSDGSDTSSDSDDTDSDTSSDSDGASTGDDDSSDDTADDGGIDESSDTTTTAPTDTPAPSTDGATTTDSAGETTTEEVTVVETTDGGTEVAAGPAAPVNNSTNGSDAVVSGGSTTDDSGGSGPGFGVVAALVALVAATLFARFRR